MGYKSKFKGSTVEERLRAVPKKQDTLVSGQNIKTILGQSLLGLGDLDITKVLYWSIDHQALLDLREDSSLVPGQLYRITDYVTTTSQENTRSTNHQFDIIVLALTNDTLSERAWACHHEGDTYFQNSHLESWQIWYCLDNDASRFAWATPTSSGGKGVIYRMIDEYNNDLPYDFKNIQFKNIQSTNNNINVRWWFALGGNSINNFISCFISESKYILPEIILGYHAYNNRVIGCRNIFIGFHEDVWGDITDNMVRSNIFTGCENLIFGGDYVSTYEIENNELTGVCNITLVLPSSHPIGVSEDYWYGLWCTKVIGVVKSTPETYDIPGLKKNIFSSICYDGTNIKRVDLTTFTEVTQ